MRTVIIAGFFPPPITGQALATEQLANLLEGQFYIKRVNLREGEENLDLKVLGNLKSRVAGYRKTGRLLADSLREHPDATLVWTSISPQPLGHFRDIATLKKTIATARKSYAVVHWGKFHTLFSSRLTARSAIGLANELDGLVFSNENRSEQCAPWLKESRRIVIPNSLDEPVRCNADELLTKQKRQLVRERLRLLFVGNMIREKGYFDVLAATKILIDEGADVQCDFAGQWLSETDKKEFEEFVADGNLTERVQHHGLIRDRGLLKQLYLDSDVFLLPSYLREAQPLSIIEAFNAATPVVTTRVGGTAGMIDDGRTGVFVAKNSPEEIAAAIQRITTDGLGEYASRARSAYELKYSPDSVRRQWVKLLEAD